MPSSYNIIKENSILTGGSKVIVTDAHAHHEKNKEKWEQDEKIEFEYAQNELMKNYEAMAQTILLNARREAERIMSEACVQAEAMRCEEAEKGYNDGFKKGYDEAYKKGYDEAYNEALEKVEVEGNRIKENADNYLNSCKKQYEDYLQDKQYEIINLICSSVESIVKKQVDNVDFVNEIVFEAISSVKNTKTIIIKVNPLYLDSLKEKSIYWKEQLPCVHEIFVIPDEDIEKGAFYVEIDGGKITANIEEAFEKIQELLMTEK